VNPPTELVADVPLDGVAGGFRQTTVNAVLHGVPPIGSQGCIRPRRHPGASSGRKSRPRWFPAWRRSPGSPPVLPGGQQHNRGGSQVEWPCSFLFPYCEAILHFMINYVHRPGDSPGYPVGRVPW